MALNEILKLRTRDAFKKDFHVIRFLGVFIAISDGKVIAVKGQPLSYCPLAQKLYGKSKVTGDIKAKEIKALVEQKISEFGSFTSQRKFDQAKIAVPFGASEMLMFALRQKVIDAAVVVCDGAGSVIVTEPDMVQMIGARMNGLFYTTPIEDIQDRLSAARCHLPFSDAAIDQASAVAKACDLGYKNIAVTVNGYMQDQDMAEIRRLEKAYTVTITILVVCTTATDGARIQEIKECADLIWSCASSDVREVIGRSALLQISHRIPVFALTSKALRFLSVYSDSPDRIKDLDTSKQYILSHVPSKEKVVMGEVFSYYLSEAHLPLRSKAEPRLAHRSKNEDFQAIGPGDDCNCSTCVFTKSQAPGDPYDLDKCPKFRGQIK